MLVSTRFYPATNTKGERVAVVTHTGRRVFPWDYALNVVENHEAAVIAFSNLNGGVRAVRRLGDTADNRGFYFEIS